MMSLATDRGTAPTGNMETEFHQLTASLDAWRAHRER